jgi:hypothetical protein
MSRSFGALIALGVMVAASGVARADAPIATHIGIEVSLQLNVVTATDDSGDRRHVGRRAVDPHGVGDLRRLTLAAGI